MGQTLKIKNSIAVTMGILLGGLSLGAGASEQQELLQLKNTVVNLVDALVKQGVLDKKQAAALISKAESDAKKQAAAQVAAAPALAVPTPAEASNVARAANGKQVVRVPYVPEFVKDEIRNQLRNEMRQDILADVSDKAKKEHWGIPDALPAWLNSIKLYGDARIRNEFDSYGSDNASGIYYNILQINKAGSLSGAGTKALLNTTEDQNRWRARARIGLTAGIADHWKFDTRLTTGSVDNPVSANVTMGNSGQRLTVALDRAQLRYDRPDEQGFNWLTISAGRIANPWLGTEMVWDDDLGFDGVAATYRHTLDFDTDGLNPVERNRKVFFTGAALPLQQPEFQSQDRWLVGGQLGANWEFENQNLLTVGAAFYDYMHMAGKRNPYGSKINDGTAPTFVQKGNLLFNIANGLSASDALYALAADYRLVDVTASIDLANLAPYHVIFTADVVKNVGFDESEVKARASGLSYFAGNDFLKDRTLGIFSGVQVGWPEVTQRGAWQMAFDYRYLQRDAVLDAFTDSDFHLGGTDTQGYRITGLYGLTKNLWMRARWMSATEIDGPPLSIDVLQVDLNAKF